MISPTAQRLLAQHAIEDDPSVLNLSYALAVEGPFDGEAFGWALARLVDEYPELGVSLLARDDLTKHVDASDRSPLERGRLVRSLISRERMMSFDLALPPLLRAVIVRLSPKRHVLILTFHHAVADSWALSEYAAFISKAYDAVTTGTALLDPVPARQTPRDLDRRRAAERSALAASLAGLTRAQCDPFPAGRSGALLRWSVALEGAGTAALNAAAIAQRMTSFALLAGTVAEVVCVAYGIDSLLLGTTVLNRHSNADIRAGEARYQGAIFRAPAGGMASLRRTAAAVAAAAERTMPYEEQVTCAGEAMGITESIDPAVFIMSDRHPMTALRLPGIETAVVAPAGEFSQAPHTAHSPRCGRIAFFWRESPAGATLNVFAEESLAACAQWMLADVHAMLAEYARIGELTPICVVPWDVGLTKVLTPPVDALSPVSLPQCRGILKRGPDDHNLAASGNR
jgi:Condensation domain